MEAIKQAIDSSIIVFLVVFMLGMALLLTILAVGFEFSKSITMGETFKVRNDISSYICIVSEVDNKLSLNCLENQMIKEESAE